MKIEIYHEKKTEQEPEKIVRFRLLEYNNGLYLTAVDKNGSVVDGGWLAYIGESGSVMRLNCVSKEIGLPLDGSGRIIVE